MRLKYDVFRAFAIATPLVGTVTVVVALVPMLKEVSAASLFALAGLLFVVTAGTLATYIAGVERPEETHEFCDPKLCIHKRHLAQRKGRRK